MGEIVGLLLWVLPLVVLYWIIRLGVRHGTLDALRTDRVDQRIAAMQADLRRRDPADGADPG